MEKILFIAPLLARKNIFNPRSKLNTHTHTRARSHIRSRHTHPAVPKAVLNRPAFRWCWWPLRHKAKVVETGCQKGRPLPPLPGHSMGVKLTKLWRKTDVISIVIFHITLLSLARRGAKIEENKPRTTGHLRLLWPVPPGGHSRQNFRPSDQNNRARTCV